MSALGRVVRGGVGRRRVQTAVVGLVAMITVTAAVLGASLLVASRAPFDRAFEQQHGAHLTARFDATKVTAGQLAGSARARGVTAAAGPFPTAVVTLSEDGGHGLPPMTVVGRTDPGGPVDALTLTAGRWVRGPGEIVLQFDGRAGPRPRLGDVLSPADLPGGPRLTIVGLARSVSETAGGWVAPAQVAALARPGTAGGYQMLYRFAAAGSAAQVDNGRAAVAATVPAGALTAALSWLTTRLDNAGRAALFVPFLIAFGVLGLLMAVLIVGNVIAGAVSTGTRRIGIMKALGFTPAQVVRAYLAQALIPALVGAALGVLAGNALTGPVLADTNSLYGTSDAGVARWIDAAVLAGVLALVAATAWLAASRAGRLRTVDALAVGRTPTPGRGRWAARLAARVPLPRPVTLGLARPFAQPVRSASMIAAIAFGAAAVTFAVGLGSALNRIQSTTRHADVIVSAGRPTDGPPPGAGPRAAPHEPAPIDPAAVAKVITAQAGTGGYTGVATTSVTAAGLTGAVETLAFTGDNSSYGYRMVSGRWFSGPGEIVVATPFLTATNTRVGDSIVLTAHGRQVTVRIVGEVFNVENHGMQVLTAAATLTAAEPGLRATDYLITLKPGTDRAGYLSALDRVLEPVGASADAVDADTADFILVINALTAFLTLMLGAVATLGVLNTVVLETRERVHDIGVHKALGMTPRQTVAAVLASVVVTGAIGGVIGAPTGVLLQRLVVGGMGHTAGFTLPASVIDVYHLAGLALFVLGGLVIAVLGALPPAGWAARTRTATALRTE